MATPTSIPAVEEKFVIANIVKVEAVLRRARVYIYRLDTETKGSTRFRNPRALGCSVPSAARALLRARGFLNRVDPIGLSV